MMRPTPYEKAVALVVMVISYLILSVVTAIGL